MNPTRNRAGIKNRTNSVGVAHADDRKPFGLGPSSSDPAQDLTASFHWKQGNRAKAPKRS
ncbi:MAG TPA: hypothetical protein VHB54_16040 [Mucilaginibacter sp.]|nr:hypothetical protein [Mucilaginibacter sp.]